MVLDEFDSAHAVTIGYGDSIEFYNLLDPQLILLKLSSTILDNLCVLSLNYSRSHKLFYLPLLYLNWM